MTQLSVHLSGPAAIAADQHVDGLVAERLASRLFAEDATLWGAEAEEEAAKRLSWVGSADDSRPLVLEVARLRSSLAEQGVDRVVLCGMGGSSLAPEVICATAGVPLVVLDSSHPDQVRAALTELERTVVVVSSKSGSTVETDSQRRAFEAAFRDAGIDPTTRVVVVTDPGSPLDEASRTAGYHVLNADPDVGGRYSALTAFGLVPSGLAGADSGALLDEAASVRDLLASDRADNPALRLGAALAATTPLRDKLVLVDEASGLQGFGDWAEQLIAESTGKHFTGVLPVVVGGPEDPEVRWPAADVTVARLVADASATPPTGGEEERSEARVAGPLGAQFLLWEAATSVAGRLLGINPFDQPDVESAKVAARSMLEGSVEVTPPDVVDGVVEVRALGNAWFGQGDDRPETAADAVERLLAQLDAERGYLAVMAYLDRTANPDLHDVRRLLALRCERPVTFGWGPRFLHSTGQLHKGGPGVGVFLQVTDEPREDLEVPDRPYSFGTLIAAQAAGDAQVLADHGRPVLRLHLTDSGKGVQLLHDLLR